MQAMENRERFLLDVFRHGGDVPAAVLRRAADIEWEQGGRDVTNAILRAGRLSEVETQLDRTRKRTTAQDVKAGRKGIDRIKRRDLLRALAVQAASIRQELFGSEGAPFDSLSAAAKWCQSHELSPWHSGMRVFGDHLREAERAVAAANASRPDIRLSLQAQHDSSLGFWLDDTRTQAAIVRVGWDSPAGKLRETVYRIASATFVSPVDLLAYILTDTAAPSPEVAHLSIQGVEVPPRSDQFVRRIFIEIDEDDFTHVQVREIHRRIRKALKVHRKKSPSRKVQKLHEAVRRLGGPPSPYDKAFWRSVVAEIQGWKSGQWRAAAEAYRRSRSKTSKRQ